ncbi:MAG: VWA domain-containing protein [Planctomycetes bacterium]|nr:VWA domain-containing protein [Planctomycetota bacterium]
MWCARETTAPGIARRRGGWLLAGAAALAALAVGAGNAQAAGLLLADGGLGGVLEIEEHAVHVTVNNGIAVTEVEQVFHNTEKRQVEALYVFPVPRGASVAEFSMWINGKEMVGEVVEKERARQIYNSYKQRRLDPGLLEQTDFRTFEMRIFPIAPDAHQKVRLTYYQELDTDHDWATYVYPLATAARKGLDTRTRGKFAFSLDAKSEVPIVAMESPSHPDRFVLAKHAPTYAQASLETRGGDLDRDLVVAFHLARPRTGLDVIASKSSGEDGFFCLTLTAGEELAANDRGMDYVFVLDISGSMEEDGKLRLSRESLGAFLKGLGKDDRFDLVTFNVQPNALFQSLHAVNAESQAQGASFLASQQARGGTVLNTALTAAYRYKDADRPLNVVVLSDGLTEQKDRAELLSLIRARPGGTRVFCIGVGNDVNRPLLEQLAEDAGGLAAFLSREDNLDRQAQAFRRKLLRPAGSNLEIAFEGDPVYDVEPRKLPNLYHGMPVRLYGRYRKGGPVKVRVRADLGSGELNQTVDLDLPEKDGGNPEVERMWAWHKVQRVQKEADRTGSRDAVIPEIVRLGEGFSIVTEYTSFLVLENDAEYQRWKIDRRNSLRLARDRKGREELDKQLAALRQKAATELGPQETAKVAPAPAAPTPASVPVASPVRAPAAPTPAPAPTQTARRGADVPWSGGGGGGGALDPISGSIALGLAALAAAARRKKQGSADKSQDEEKKDPS